MTSIQAQRYVEIAAELELISWRGDATNGASGAKSRIISVTCITGNHEWRVENNFLRRAEEKWHFDGTNVYQSIRPTEPTPKSERDRIARTSGLALAPFEVARSNVTINIWPSPHGHPLGDAGVNIPWLAFCSGNYLRRPGRLLPLPLDVLRHTPDRFAYTDQTETFQDELGLPRTVDLFTSKTLYQSSVEDFYREGFRGDRYSEWTKSVVSNLPEDERIFHYAVTQSTNFHGWTFPTRFEFFQAGRKHVQNGDWFHRGIGRVKSIRSAARPEGLFVPRLQQTIVDRRFRDPATLVDAIIYTSTNRLVSPTNDPALQEKFKAKVARSAGR